MRAFGRVLDIPRLWCGRDALPFTHLSAPGSARLSVRLLLGVQYLPQGMHRVDIEVGEHEAGTFRARPDDGSG